MPLKSGDRFEEPWHDGTAVNPGVAIKVSSTEDGIHTQKDEINFSYTVDASDPSKVWVDLSNIRGKTFNNNAAFHTCHGAYQWPQVPTRQCHATDDIELTLCNTVRTTVLKDTTPLDKIFGCYGKPGHGQPKPPCSTVCANKPDGKPKPKCENKPDYPPCATRPKCPRDCGAQLHNTICSAKVTYPRRFSQVARNATTIWATTMPVRVALRKDSTKTVFATPVCDMVEEMLGTKVKDCDEAKAERWAKKVSEEFCGENPFPEFDAICEDLKQG